MKNYIGVTGVANISDTYLTIAEFRKEKIDLKSKHVPMIGFLVCKKTLYEIPPKSFKIPHQRYPPISSLKRMMEYSKNHALNMIHFGANDDIALGDDIIKLFNETRVYQENLCKALQLNIPWPKQNELEKILKKFPDISIVLQLSRKILQKEDNKSIAKKVNSYNGLIRGVLIDPSGGKGQEFCKDRASQTFDSIRKLESNLMIGIGGGLRGDIKSYKKIRSLRESINTSNFSVDAENGLRVYEKDNNGKVMIDMLKPESISPYIYFIKQALTS